MFVRYFKDAKASLQRYTLKEIFQEIASTILNEINKVRRMTVPDFETYFKATAIKTVWYWQKNHWNGIENTEADSHKYS